MEPTTCCSVVSCSHTHQLQLQSPEEYRHRRTLWVQSLVAWQPLVRYRMNRCTTISWVTGCNLFLVAIANQLNTFWLCLHSQYQNWCDWKQWIQCCVSAKSGCCYLVLKAHLEFHGMQWRSHNLGTVTHFMAICLFHLNGLGRAFCYTCYHRMCRSPMKIHGLTGKMPMSNKG